ncbi:substrate-binding domain-containing protein [Oceanisphaera arctica]|uniref:Sugar ABC transporter substrate-binding protein n=1 Tax=Oceanisphaera arctica TaxID=641510 RepID=A0A2P5TP95_9GAMM|nr:substrate-binding domain-containing protein [Oceanisphaera arctica]PPL17505.1 sugar ABC transporter substrate-binding protein [Oceanisphaera arctica]GHA16674.1 autoinducer 2-binding periplasmic protein LuxP [Oceanisphaera arctica]
MLIRRLLLGWILSGLTLPVWASDHTLDHWSFQEYLDAFPHQRNLSDAFSARIRQAAEPWTASTDRPVRIAMLIPDQQVSDYWSRNQKSFTSRLQEIGLPFTLKSYSSHPETTSRVQEQQLLEALNGDPDYLVFTLNSLRHRVLIDKIMARGRPKLILMNVTTPLKHWGKNQPFLYVGFDHAEGTRLLADAISKMTGKQANYLMLYGTRGYVSQARGDEFIRLTSDQPGFTLRQAFYTDVNREKARQAVLQTLATSPDINLIYACTTDIALGAIDALKQLNREDKIILNGWGGGSAELDALAQGSLDLTVMRMNDDNGVAMAEAIRLDQEGKASQIPQVYSGDFAVVDKDTPTAELERLKANAFRYSQ